MSKTIGLTALEHDARVSACLSDGSVPPGIPGVVRFADSASALQSESSNVTISALWAVNPIGIARPAEINCDFLFRSVADAANDESATKSTRGGSVDTLERQPS